MRGHARLPGAGAVQGKSGKVEVAALLPNRHAPPGGPLESRSHSHAPPLCAPAQVLCGTPRLLALGRCCGLRLQVHATTSAAASAGVVGAVAAAWLERWQGLGPALQYSVEEEAPRAEAFLTRWAGRGGGGGGQRFAGLCYRRQRVTGQAGQVMACSALTPHLLPPLTHPPQVLLPQPAQRCAAAVPGPQPGAAAAPGRPQPAAGGAGAEAEAGEPAGSLHLLA